MAGASRASTRAFTCDPLAALSCDWECCFASAYEGCSVDLASYWLSWALVDLTDWGKRRLGCP